MNEVEVGMMEYRKRVEKIKISHNLIILNNLLCDMVREIQALQERTLQVINDTVMGSGIQLEEDIDEELNERFKGITSVLLEIARAI